MARSATYTRKGQARRDEVLRAAALVIAERGYAGVTHRAVAEQAGVPLATTSYFFGSIDELVCEAAAAFLDKRVAELEESVRVFAAEPRSPAEGCDLVVDVLLAMPSEQPLSNFEVYLNAARRPEVASIAAESLRRLELLATEALRVMGVRDPAAAARTLTAVCDGFLVHRLARPTTADRAAMRRVVRTLVIVELMDEDERAAAEAGLDVARPSGPASPDGAGGARE